MCQAAVVGIDLSQEQILSSPKFVVFRLINGMMKPSERLCTSDHVLNQRALRHSLAVGLIFGACAIDQFVAEVWQHC